MSLAVIGLCLPAAAVWLWLTAETRASAGSRAVTAALATCGGLGLSSLTTFWLLQAGVTLGRGFAVIDAAIWAALIGAALWRRLRATTRSLADPERRGRRLTADEWLARIGFVAVAGLAAWTAAVDYGLAPHGQWDAWAVWNHKARFLVRGGADWDAMLTIPWANPAHPFLVSAIVARLWAYAGAELVWVPALVAVLFGAATAAVVMGSLGLERARAWLAGVALLAPATMISQITAQQADAPLAFFVVAALVVILAGARTLRVDDRGRMLVAGALAGLAAWTKNEGLVLLAAVAAIVLWTTARRSRWRSAVWFAAAAVPMVATVMWLKLELAPVPPPYLLESQESTTLLGRVFGDEGAAILAAVARGLRTWGGPLTQGALLVTIAAGGRNALRHRGGAASVVLATVGVMFASYCAVFVMTPLDAVPLIDATLPRLLAQVWPALVFAAFWTEPPGRVEPATRPASTNG